jgi:glutamyl-tRNA synthetase
VTSHRAARQRRGQTAGVRGRFAPSPTGELHVGNLRTALAARLSVEAQGGDLVVRMEDLDPITSSPEHEVRQLADLAAIGVRSDAAVVRQSERFDRYRTAIAQLDARGLVYPCFCTRREIRDASAAPHDGGLPDGAYPGTCRDLSDAQRRRHERDGRRPALRLRTDGESYAFDDVVAGASDGAIDDVVLQRNDGTPAYNLAVVIDDDAQGVTEVVRGDDLLSSTPRQIHLQRLLGVATPTYAHVPLVVGTDGRRLAKRHGAVTLAAWVRTGRTSDELRVILQHSLGVGPDGRFAWADVPRAPWTWPFAT